MSREIKENRIVSDLVKSPSRVPTLRMITGFLGKSDKKGYLRIYSDLELYQYVDVYEDDIKKTAPTGEGDFYPTRFWVESCAQLYYHGTTQRQVRAEFLDGEIMEEIVRNGGTVGKPLVSNFGVIVPGALATTGFPCSCPTVSHSCTSKCLCDELTAPTPFED